MKKQLLAFMLSAIATASPAAVNTLSDAFSSSKCVSAFDPYSNPDMQKGCCSSTDALLAAAGEDADMLSINLDFVCDDDTEVLPFFSPVMAVPLYDEAILPYFFSTFDFGSNEFWTPLTVPPGKYDIVVFSTTTKGLLNIIHEEVDIEESVNLTFKTSEATERIEFDPRLSNGDKIDPTSYNMFETDENGEHPILKKGNCTDVNYAIYFSIDEIAHYLYRSNIACFMNNSGEFYSTQYKSDVWVNPNNKFTYHYSVAVPTYERGMEYIELYTDKSVSHVVNNPIENFLPAISAEFYDQILPELDTKAYNCWGYTNFNSYPIQIESLSSSGNIDGTMVSVCPYKRDTQGFIYPMQRKVLFYDEERSNYYGIQPPFLTYDPEIGYSYLIKHQTEIYEFVKTEGNSAFSFPASQNPVFGSTTPFVLFSHIAVPVIDYAFYGNCGEVRDNDMYNPGFLVRVDGETICASRAEAENMYELDFWEDGAKPWEIIISTEGNLIIDNIPAKTSCKVTYEEAMPEYIPTLTMLQMRDKDNNVTNRFDTSEQGLITLSAGGFKYNFEGKGENQYLYEDLAEIKVEVALNGTSDYTVLDLTEDPSKFYMPGYGAYYYSTLDNLETTGNNNWFDVRITLADNAGNCMVQNISPAFFISGTGGTDTIPYGDYEGEVYYDLNGCKVKSGDLQKGVYIIRQGNRVSKEIIM